MHKTALFHKALNISSNKITIRQPDDWHLHLRDGSILGSVVAYSAGVFSRAVVMPNLQPPITTVQSARDYKKRIIEAVPKGLSFSPLMTVYLTDSLSSKVLEEGFKEDVFFGAKLYPANSTTNSETGVTDLNGIDNLFETMEIIGMPLLIHGEVTDKDVDIFDREAVFIDKFLEPLLHRHPSLKVVLEHITTEQAVQFVETSNFSLAATITPHHLHINRNSMFEGGLRSDFYCLPVAKRERHRLALRKAATSGNSHFFLGTDSAPHLRASKETSCGCAGIFNSPYALESYLQVFEEEGALDKFELFASENGPNFYGVPLNKGTITLRKEECSVPFFIKLVVEDHSIGEIVPFHAGQRLKWIATQA